MKHWSIAKRLKLGVGSLAALIFVLALGAVGSALFLKTEFQFYKDSSLATNDINAIAEDLFEARIAGISYLRNPSPELIEEFGSNLQEIRAGSQTLLGMTDMDEATRAHLTEETDRIDAFDARFAEAADHQAERERLIAMLAQIGPDVHQTITDLLDASNRAGDAGTTFNAARVQAGLLLGLFYMERFLLSGQPDAFETSRSHLSKALQQLSWMATMVSDSTRADLVAQARDGIASYVETAEATEAASTARDAALATVDEAAIAAMSGIETLVDDFVALQTDTGTMIDTTFMTTLVLLGALAVLALGYALILMRAILGQTAREFDATLETVSELADGNLDVEIEGAERETELGRIAKALEVFRDKGREAADLARQTEEAKVRAAAEERRREEDQRAAEQQRAEAEKQVAEARKREIFDTLRAAVSGVVSAAAAGDFSRRVETASLDPELASLAEDINRLMANVDRGLEEIAKLSARLAQGDLRAGMAGDFEGTFRALQENFEAMTSSLSAIMLDISAEAQGVRTQSGEMKRGAEDLARRAEAQAASLEETSAAMTEIASSAESNAGSASETNSAATAMSEEAGQARTVLQATIAAMTDIEDHAKEIEAIVDVIEDIAFQTNLLSLNASVEAARAGEAGKGFAVVANEVRALAQRSAEASSKVQQIILQSTSAISRGSGAVGETGETLSRIVEQIESVSMNLREIKSASEEQATAVKDISNAFAQLDKITQKNAAVAEETRGAAALLSSQSERMEVAVSRVRVRGDKGQAGTPAAGQATGKAARSTGSAAA